MPECPRSWRRSSGSGGMRRSGSGSGGAPGASFASASSSPPASWRAWTRSSARRRSPPWSRGSRPARSIPTPRHATSSSAWRRRRQAGPLWCSPPSRERRLTWRSPSITLGSLELVPLSDGFFMLDGGAMFGVVPKPLWERVAPADGRNRIRMGMRPLLVRGERTVLIDAGCGDKMDAKAADIYGFDRSRHLDHALADAGVAAAEVDVVDCLAPAFRSCRRVHGAGSRWPRAPPVPARAVRRPRRGVVRRVASA